METTDEYKLLLEFFGQPIEQMEWKYFEEKKFNCLHKASFHSVSDYTVGDKPNILLTSVNEIFLMFFAEKNILVIEAYQFSQT